MKSDHGVTSVLRVGGMAGESVQRPAHASCSSSYLVLVKSAIRLIHVACVQPSCSPTKNRGGTAVHRLNS